MSFFYSYLSLYLVVIAVVSPFYALSQKTKQPLIEIERDPLAYEIEADPLAYLLQGYSLHAAVTYSGFRSSIGVYGIKPPKFLIDNDAFSVYTLGFDLKTDYLFGDIKGFYAGVQATYSMDRIGLKDEQYREDIWGLNIGVRTGYRFMFGKKENQYKGFYLTPWVALMYSPSAKTIQHGTQEYRQSSWVPFPTLHAGWRF